MGGRPARGEGRAGAGGYGCSGVGLFFLRRIERPGRWPVILPSRRMGMPETRTEWKPSLRW